MASTTEKQQKHEKARVTTESGIEKEERERE